MTDRRPTEIAVISGKGGTGKTTVAGALAVLAGGRAVLADCDVDAANLGLILRPSVREEHDFTGGQRAVIDPESCTGCGLCAEKCRSEAIVERPRGRAASRTGSDGLSTVCEVDPFSCEGCGVCSHVCPAGAVIMEDTVSGRWFVSDTPHGPLVHARLEPGEENSGKLVTQVRNKARELAGELGKELIIIDGPPGIGCPVIASLSGISRALVVTEPSLSAIHDMERVLEVCRHFDVAAGILVNRFDLDEGNTRSIEDLAARREIPVLGKLPYEPAVVETLVRGRTVVEDGETEVSRGLRDVWEKLTGRR